MNRTYFTRGFALLLAVMLLLTGCATTKPGDTTAATDATTGPAPDQITDATEGSVDLEGKTLSAFLIKYF